mgnify:CR=1 FL=1
MNYPLRIETARLYTRALTRDDAAAWTHFLENAEATQYFPKLPVTPAERAEIWIESQLKRYSEGWILGQHSAKPAATHRRARKVY